MKLYKVMFTESKLREYVIVASLLLAAPVILRYLYHQIRLLSRPGTEKTPQTTCPCGPVKDSVFGFDFIYNIIFGESDDNYLATTCKLFKEYGSTYSMKSCVWETIFTRDSQNIKQMLSTSFNDFELPHLRLSAISTLLGTGIFSVNGASWSHARAMLRPCFANRDKLAITATLEQHFQSFLRHIPRDKSQVDLQPVIFALAMDFATELLATKSSYMLDATKSHDKEWQFFDDYTTCSEEVIKRMCLGPLQVFRYNRSAVQAKKRVFNYIDDFIDNALESSVPGESTEHNVLLKMAGLTSDRKVLRDQILHLLVASRDTTASLLCNLFFMLAKEPAMYKKLRQEVLSVCGDVPPTPEELKQMEYLRWCVQECKSFFSFVKPHSLLKTMAGSGTQDKEMALTSSGSTASTSRHTHQRKTGHPGYHAACRRRQERE